MNKRTIAAIMLPITAIAVTVCPQRLNRSIDADIAAYSIHANAFTNQYTGKIHCEGHGYDATETYYIECWGEYLDGSGKTNFCSGFYQGQAYSQCKTPEIGPDGCVYSRIGCDVTAYSPRVSAKFTGQWFHSP